MGVYFQGSDTLQIYYNEFRDVRLLPSRFLIDTDELDSYAGLEKVDDVSSLIKSHKRIVIERSYALGDVLLLIPVVRRLREELFLEHVTLVTQTRFVDNPIISVLGDGVYDEYVTKDDILRGSSTYDIGIMLDGVLERDHTQPKYQHTHRVNIFMDWFELKGDVSWDCEKTWKKKEHIVVQTGGSGVLKELPLETRDYIVEKLREEKYEVVRVGDGAKVSDAEYLELIGTASCVVSMDSSPLWISHFTKTPCVLILGPTRKEERLTMHPLYPERAKAVALNELIDCPSCFEQREKCLGAMDCFHVDKEKVVELVLEAIREVR